MRKYSVLDKLLKGLPAEPINFVIDPTEWMGVDLAACDDCQYPLTDHEIAKIDYAIVGVKKCGLQIKDIRRENFL